LRLGVRRSLPLPPRMNDKEAAHAKPQRKARLFVLEEKCFAAWREAVFAVAFSTWNLERGAHTSSRIQGDAFAWTDFRSSAAFPAGASR